MIELTAESSATQRLPPIVLEDDTSCEISARIASAKAILDLLAVLHGSLSDGSDGRLDQVDPRTVRSALWCAHRQLEEAEGLAKAAP